MRFLVPVGGDIGSAYGVITAPNHKGVPAGIVAGLPWAADVGCLDGPAFVKRVNMSETIDWLNTAMLPYRRQCLFIAGADVVGDSQGTMEAYEEFNRYFAGWPFAWIAQNGAIPSDIPATCAAIFVGGVPMNQAGDDWKDSLLAVDVIRAGQRLGKHIHIGRVNWGRRYRLFRVLSGSELFTCDGTRTRYDGRDKTLAAWNGYEAQPPLLTI